ncbi:MAG: hypothetical protein ACFE9C_05790 [Candidatus Hodarchaeota archaeon]
MIKLKTEIIFLSRMTGQLLHHSSMETKELKIDKKNFFQEALQYIEQHIESTGFKVLNVTSAQGGIGYFLIKE